MVEVSFSLNDYCSADKVTLLLLSHPPALSSLQLAVCVFLYCWSSVCPFTCLSDSSSAGPYSVSPSTCLLACLLSVGPSINQYLSICPSASIYLVFLYISLNLSICLSIYLSVSLSIYIYISVSLSIYISVCLSVCLYICLSF